MECKSYTHIKNAYQQAKACISEFAKQGKPHHIQSMMVRGGVRYTLVPGLPNGCDTETGATYKTPMTNRKSHAEHCHRYLKIFSAQNYTLFSEKRWWGTIWGVKPITSAPTNTFEKSLQTIISLAQ